MRNRFYALLFHRPIALFFACILCIFVLASLYAPLLCSSNPIFVLYNDEWYFPLLKAYFSKAFFSKDIDILFNILGVLFPFFLLCYFFQKNHQKKSYLLLSCIGLLLYVWFSYFGIYDLNVSCELTKEREDMLEKIELEQKYTLFRPRYPLPSWRFEVDFMTSYKKLDLILEEDRILQYSQDALQSIKTSHVEIFSLYAHRQEQLKSQMEMLSKEIASKKSDYIRDVSIEMDLRIQALTTPEKCNFLLLEKTTKANRQYEMLENQLEFLRRRNYWLENNKISYSIMPLIKNTHWEDDVGGNTALNSELSYWYMTRINRKDLISALIFGIRISLLVGVASILLSLMIGIPLGLASGFYGGNTDIVLSRFMEIWESMPAFFMLLLIVSIMQTKSLFLIIVIIAIFGWTSIFRFVRAEVFRQKELAYVDAARTCGFSSLYILVKHILPNSLLAVITLIPFDIMAAITKEAGLSFLGLGEEQSCSWGVLMDEGRAAFPSESALLWPPAIMLTLLLVSIAFVGDVMNSALDPKASKS